MKLEILQKAATFKSFLLLGYKNTQSLFFVTVFFNIFTRQTLTDDFRGFTQKYELRVSFKIVKRQPKTNC